MNCSGDIARVIEQVNQLEYKIITLEIIVAVLAVAIGTYIITRII